MRTLLALALGATLAMALASCAQILGLDENLGPADASIEASSDAAHADSGDDEDAAAGADATSEGGMRGGSDAGDASLVDGADGSGGADAASGPWQLDRSYGNDGAALLLSGMTDDQPDLELVEVPAPSATLEAGVHAVGIAGTGSQFLVSFKVDEPGSAPTTLPLTSATSTSYRLLGAFASDAAIVAFAQDVDTLRVEEAVLMGPGQGALMEEPNPSAVTISRLVQQTGDESFVGPGTTGDEDTVKGVEVTVANSVTPVVVDPNPDVLLARGVTTNGTRWFGGFASNIFPLSAVGLQPLGAGQEATLLFSDESGSQSSVTDFAAAGMNLFAVGFVGSSFAVWPMPADSTTPPARIIPPGAANFVGGLSCTLPGNFCFIRSAVSGDDKIVVSGALGDPYLATFDENGNETALLAPFDGGAAVSSLDLKAVLPPLPQGNGQWNAGAVLPHDDYLYAAFASSGSNPMWAVVRLKRGTGP
jgi:hypothetical protein